MCGFIAQLIEQRTGKAEVMGSNPVEALIFFFRLLLSNCLNLCTSKRSQQQKILLITSQYIPRKKVQFSHLLKF